MYTVVSIFHCGTSIAPRLGMKDIYESVPKCTIMSVNRGRFLFLFHSSYQSHQLTQNLMYTPSYSHECVYSGPGNGYGQMIF